MRRIARTITLLVAAMLFATVVAAQSSRVDKATSDKLTKYLHGHRLPMVGAQVMNTDSGRQLMLYGYVATDFGKDDAVTKSRKFLHDSSISVINNIRVNPEVKHLKHKAPIEEGPEGSMDSGMTAPPPRADWENTVDSTLRAGGATPSNDPALRMPAPGGAAPVSPGATW